MLSAEQVAQYKSDGYLALDGLVDARWVSRLNQAASGFVDQSRSMTTSNNVIDLEADHTEDNPRLRRLINPADQHPAFAEFVLKGPPAAVAMALLGGPVRFHHSKLNYKWSGGGQAVDWHQDIQYWPHSDFSPVTIGVYLDDVDRDMGAMGVVPKSHTGELFNLYSGDQWAGSIQPEDLERSGYADAVWLTGSAGSATVHNCCSVHGSPPNNSDRVRPLLLQTYSASNSYPLLGVGTNGRTGGLSGTVIGGEPPRTLTVQGREMPAAPDWSKGGYSTIFDAQAIGP